MTIKLVLTAALVLLAVLVISQKSASKLVRWAVAASVATGGYFVWFPEHLTFAAQTLGVGRGTDLLVYLWVTITFGMLLLLYLKIVETNRVVTLLAREIALMRASTPEQPPAAIDYRRIPPVAAE